MPTPPISGVPTSIAAFADFFSKGPLNQPISITSLASFQRLFGPLDVRSEASYQVQQFFLNGGTNALILNTGPAPLTPASLAPLNQPGLFNLLSLPATANLAPEPMLAIMQAALALCQTNRAFYLPDIPPSTVVATAAAIQTWFAASKLNASNAAAIYFPRLTISDPLRKSLPREIAASGVVAGIYARTDVNRGVSRAPAGLEADIHGGATPVLAINDVTNAQLNVLGINAIRSFPGKGTLIWGSRTTRGADPLADEYKYIPVRRLALYIESSVVTSLFWTASQPDNEILWSAIRLTVSDFLNTIFRSGALQGPTPSQSYFVRCDSTTTTQQDILANRVNIIIGFAPLKPAEFILIRITLPTD